ncbi:MAG: hypothetical protein AAGG75_06030 [Bacteroidota bacterium]
MKNSKLLELLRHLQPQEIRSYLKFLRSPFYASNNLPEQLFQFIYKYAPDYTSPKLNKEQAFKKLFPHKEKYSDHQMRKLIHELRVLTEEYFIAKQVQGHSYTKKQLLLAEYRERNMYTHFQKTSQELLADQAAKPHRDISYYKELHLLHEGFYDHPQTHKEKDNISYLLAAIENLDYYYLLQRQRLSYALTWIKKLFQVNLTPRSLKEHTAEIKATPIFQVYDLINQMLEAPREDSLFEQAEQLFRDRLGQLTKKDQEEIFRILINHLSNQYNSGRKELQTKLFELYQFGMEHQLFISDHQMEPHLFSNVVTLGVLEKQFDWVQQFIDQYTTYLSEAVRADTVCLNQALLALHTQQYQSCIELLRDYNFPEVFLLLRSKTILLRAYFELCIQDYSYHDILMAKIEAFRKFIARHRFISEAKQQTYLQFLSFSQKIVNQYFKGTIGQPLYDEIEASQSVILKSWLLSQCSLLAQQKK